MKNPTEILLSGYKEKYIFNKIDSLKKSGIKLYELLKQLKEKKISDKTIIEQFEKEGSNLKNY